MSNVTKQAGIALIEVVIALLILGVGIVTLVQFQADLVQNRTVINQRARAVQLAESKLESLRHFAVINTTPDYPAYEDIATGTANVSATSANYTLAWTVTENTEPPYKTIVVVVSWVDLVGEPQSVTLNTIVGRVNPALSGTIIQGLP